MKKNKKSIRIILVMVCVYIFTYGYHYFFIGGIAAEINQKSEFSKETPSDFLEILETNPLNE